MYIEIRFTFNTLEKTRRRVIKFLISKNRLTQCVLALGLSLPVAAIAALIPDSIYDSYMSAVSGDKRATQKTYEAIKKLREAAPDDLLVNTVLGSTETMLARDAWIPWKKLKFAELGLSRMDKALKRAADGSLDGQTIANMPAYLWMQTTIGCTFIEMPEMFDRLSSGYRILADAVESENAKSQEISSLASLYLCAGQAALKTGDSDAARTYLAIIVDEAPNAEEAATATTLLSEL